MAAQTIIKKNANGYGYKYSDLAQLNEQMEALGWRYQTCTMYDTESRADYIMIRLYRDGKWEEWLRGSKIIETAPGGKANPAQAYGSGLTYAIRYSLIMACGFATTDDDAKLLDKEEPEQTKKQEAPKKAKTCKEVKALYDYCMSEGGRPMWEEVKTFYGIGPSDAEKAVDALRKEQGKRKEKVENEQ